MIIRKDKLQTEDMNLNPDSWIIAMLVDSEGYHTCCGRRKTGIYTIQIDRKNCD